MISSGILDSHHHVWDTRALEYELLNSIPELNQAFTIDDYEGEATSLGVISSICVEAASAGADGRRETEWLIRHLESNERVAALVAWAPLEQPELDVHLDWLKALDGKPIVGIRRSFEFEPSDFPSRPEVVAGATLAGERAFVVDLVLFSRSLRATIALVAACPGTTFVLDHLAKPPIRERRLNPWSDELRELALYPNVACKLSGLSTEADRLSWTDEELKPYVEHALGCLGPDRLLYGSDWPVVNLAGGQRRWLAASNALLAHLDERERRAVFAENARRIYSVQ